MKGKERRKVNFKLVCLLTYLRIYMDRDYTHLHRGKLVNRNIYKRKKLQLNLPFFLPSTI